MQCRDQAKFGNMLPGVVEIFNGLVEQRKHPCVSCGTPFQRQASIGIMTTVGMMCFNCFSVWATGIDPQDPEAPHLKGGEPTAYLPLFFDTVKSRIREPFRLARTQALLGLLLVGWSAQGLPMDKVKTAAFLEKSAKVGQQLSELRPLAKAMSGPESLSAAIKFMEALQEAEDAHDELFVEFLETAM